MGLFRTMLETKKLTYQLLIKKAIQLSEYVLLEDDTLIFKRIRKAFLEFLH